MWDRLSCRNQPDHLADNLVAIGIGHHQNRAGYHSNRLPSLLSIDNAILNAERPGIVENRLGGLKLTLCFAWLRRLLSSSHSKRINSASRTAYVLVHAQIKLLRLPRTLRARAG